MYETTIQKVNNKDIVKQVTKFHKIFDDLKNVKMNTKYGGNVLLLLNSLPISFEHVNEALLYGNECAINLDDVQTDVRSKELLISPRISS